MPNGNCSFCGKNSSQVFRLSQRECGDYSDRKDDRSKQVCIKGHVMARNFGIMSGRPVPWGHSGNQPPAGDAKQYNRADSIQSAARKSTPLPRAVNSEGSNLPFFIPREPLLERGKVSQALFDIGAVIAACVVVSLTGISIGISLFILFFVAV